MEEEIFLALEQTIQELEQKQILTCSNYHGFERALLSKKEEIIDNFQLLFQYECPASFRVGLFFPDTISVSWKSENNDKISGEFSLNNIFLAVDKTLDESLHEWQFKEIKLADMRIMDSVIFNGEPIYTLIHLGSSGIAENLYTFNTRELFLMELNYEEYLKKMIQTKGIIYWQYLFCREMQLTGYEKAVIKEEIKFLETTFVNKSYEELWFKLEEKSN